MKGGHDVSFDVTSDTGGCHNDNFVANDDNMWRTKLLGFFSVWYFRTVCVADVLVDLALIFMDNFVSGDSLWYNVTDYSWSFMTIHDLVWLFMIVCDDLWSY